MGYIIYGYLNAVMFLQQDTNWIVRIHPKTSRETEAFEFLKRVGAPGKNCLYSNAKNYDV